MLDPRSSKWTFRLLGSLILSVLLVPTYFFYGIGGCDLALYPEQSFAHFMMRFLCSTPGVVTYIAVVAFFPFWLTLLLRYLAGREPRESDEEYQRWHG